MSGSILLSWEVGMADREPPSILESLCDGFITKP